MSQGRTIALTPLAITALTLPAATTAAPPPPTEPSAPYRVEGADTPTQVTRLRATGFELLPPAGAAGTAAHRARAVPGWFR